MGTTWEDRKTTGNKLSCDHKEQKQKTCHEYTEHKNQLQQNGGRQDLRDLGEIWGPPWDAPTALDHKRICPLEIGRPE